MKRLFYFILLLVGVSTVHSCKDLLDEDGNPLLDINDNTGLNGPRALYREITNADTLATYHYNGLQLSKVVTDSMNSTADVAWSGNKISRIDFRGFLDLDKNGKMEKDSIVYTQQFTYAGTGKLEKISENRSYYHRITTTPFSVTNPSPQMLYKKVSSLFELKYSSSTGKLESTNMKSGPDGPGINFDTYADTKYEYSGDNVSKVVKNYGPITAGVPGAATRKLGFEYNNYDANINPFTLLPFEYKVTRLIDMDIYLAGLTTLYLANDRHPDGWMISPNNPKRMSITDLAVPVPTPTFFSTNYRYDPQTYMTAGYTVNYKYKPL